MKVWTDGACSPQSENRKGGWGLVAKGKNGITELCGYELDTTNNRMEMKAFLAGLRLLNATDEDEKIIYTDSAYISNCFYQKWYVNWQKNGWVNAKKAPVENKDLWELLIAEHNDSITIVKVKGHAGDPHNEWADRIAVYCKENQSEWKDRPAK